MEARNNYLLKKNETKKNKDSGRPSTDSPCKKKKKLQRLKTITNRSTKSNDEKQTIQDNVNKKQTKKTVTQTDEVPLTAQVKKAKED